MTPAELVHHLRDQAAASVNASPQPGDFVEEAAEYMFMVNLLKLVAMQLAWSIPMITACIGMLRRKRLARTLFLLVTGSTCALLVWAAADLMGSEASMALLVLPLALVYGWLSFRFHSEDVQALFQPGSAGSERPRSG